MVLHNFTHRGKSKFHSGKISHEKKLKTQANVTVSNPISPLPKNLPWVFIMSLQKPTLGNFKYPPWFYTIFTHRGKHKFSGGLKLERNPSSPKKYFRGNLWSFFLSQNIYIVSIENYYSEITWIILDKMLHVPHAKFNIGEQRGLVEIALVSNQKPFWEVLTAK